MIQFSELTLPHFIAAGVGLYLCWALFLKLRSMWRRVQARRYYKRYEQERDAYYNATASAPRRPKHLHSHTHLQHEEYIKDKDTRVHNIAKPQGFWTKLIMGEKMNMIREMIRIANSSEHKGYWQDRVEAQKRVEGQRQMRDEGQGR